jgi:hypothetical protein
VLLVELITTQQVEAVRAASMVRLEDLVVREQQDLTALVLVAVVEVALLAQLLAVLVVLEAFPLAAVVVVQAH